jgi:acetylornithine/succinyldiaminopimelate/putrescine aminotransferase
LIFKTIGDVRGVGMFVGFELVSDRNLRTPNPDAADFVLKRFRAEKVLMQADGPDVNVIKLKPPIVFNKVKILFILRNGYCVCKARLFHFLILSLCFEIKSVLNFEMKLL